MKLLFCGPIALEHLSGVRSEIPPTYSFPFTGKLVAEWNRAGHEVDVLALSEHVTETKEYSYDFGSIFIGPMRSRARDRALDCFKAEREAVRKLVAKSSADAISAHWTYEFALGALSARPDTFVTAHDMPLRYAWQINSTYRWIRTLMAFRVVQRVENMSVVSPEVAQHFSRVMRYKRDIAITPNGVNLENLGSRNVSDSAAQIAHPLFATVLNGFTRVKNAEVALRALFELRKRLPQARLEMFGAGYEAGGPAERWAVSRGLSGGVLFRGPVDHDVLMRTLRGGNHTLIHPSRIEANPVTVIEAAAIRVPLVLPADCRGSMWVVGGHEGATVYEHADDSVELADAMADAVTNAHGVTTASTQAAYNRVQREFTLGASAGRYLAWFAGARS